MIQKRRSVSLRPPQSSGTHADRPLRCVLAPLGHTPATLNPFVHPVSTGTTPIGAMLAASRGARMDLGLAAWLLAAAVSLAAGGLTGTGTPRAPVPAPSPAIPPLAVADAAVPTCDQRLRLELPCPQLPDAAPGDRTALSEAPPNSLVPLAR